MWNPAGSGGVRVRRLASGRQRRYLRHQGAPRLRHIRAHWRVGRRARRRTFRAVLWRGALAVLRRQRVALRRAATVPGCKRPLQAAAVGLRFGDCLVQAFNVHGSVIHQCVPHRIHNLVCLIVHPAPRDAVRQRQGASQLVHHQAQLLGGQRRGAGPDSLVHVRLYASDQRCAQIHGGCELVAQRVHTTAHPGPRLQQCYSHSIPLEVKGGGQASGTGPDDHHTRRCGRGRHLVVLQESRYLCFDHSFAAVRGQWRLDRGNRFVANLFFALHLHICSAQDSPGGVG
mmetsp:Transcript_20392/g.61429  ORF Transcript_20392/g.61429 Transcript_20392/m.61429 type:complete len:286 (-) Transcript_20392:741-1598(-)